MSSSSQPFRESSPAGAPGRRRSQYTYRHFSQLATYSTSTPLRVIAHIDLDAFYAQCEMIRLGVAEDKPLAVQQWQGLIAVNYPAREYGIGRHCTITEAKKLCPELINQHVATWREGDEKWAYHADAAANIATHKVSLDPYRLQSRKILALIKESLPGDLQKVEKAGIDEVFLDLSAHVHSVMLQRFPELASPPPYDDPSERLPAPSTTALDWQADALVDLDEDEAETDDPDWDDVAILIGSEIARGVRRAIRERLQYTCSAGIANNKMLCKLGSAHKKPNQQTVVRTRAVQHFMSAHKFTKIRNLGGKLGEQVAQSFDTESVKDLLAVPLEQLKGRLGDDTGSWVYNTIRGIDTSEVSSRTDIKSMLSAKSFRPSINSFEQGVKWLRIFAADIFSRLVEEGVLENKRRPKTINLHHRHAGQTRSRQSPIPQGRPIDEAVLFDLAKHLLSQIVAEGQVWPCANLSLSIGGFENGVTGNMGIGAFLVKGEEAQAMKLRPGADEPHQDQQRPDKRRRVESEGIQRFLTRRAAQPDEDPPLGRDGWALHKGGEASDGAGSREDAAAPEPLRDATLRQRPITDYMCSRCDATFDSEAELQSHQDWHFAKDLQDEERVKPAFVRRASPSAPPPRGTGQTHAAAGARRPGRPKKPDPGQTRLNFG